MSDCLLGLLFSFSLLLAGVFGADVTVTVMKGDNVTLPINLVKIKDVEKLRWTFKDNDSVTIDVMLKNIDKKVQYNGEKFKDRLHVNIQNGSLTIPNIRTQDTGKYELEIKKSNDKILNPIKTFNVSLNDQVIMVSVIKGDNFTLPTGEIETHCVKEWKFNGNDLTDSTIRNITADIEYKVDINCTDFILHRTVSVNLNDEESVSELKGETLTLDIDTEKQADDVIEWKFKDVNISELNRTETNPTGSLIIKKLKTEDSGLYDVNIKSSNRFIHKRFRVTVTESSSGSHQVKIGPGLFVLVIMLVIVLV